MHCVVAISTLKRTLLVIGSVLFLLLACTRNDYSGSVDSSENYSLRIISSDTLSLNRLNPDLSINRIRRHIATHPESEYFLLVDDLSNSILVFDYAGNLISKFGKRGRGPEEFVRINSYGIGSNNEIATYDSSLDLIRVFSIDGELLVTRPGLLQYGLWNRGNQISILDENLIFSIEESKYSSPDNFWYSAIVAKYGSDLDEPQLSGKHDPQNVNSDYLYKYGLHGVDYVSNKIYTLHRIGYYLQEFDFNSDTITSRFGLIPEYFKIWNDEAKEQDGFLDRRLKNVNQSFSNNPIICKNLIFHPYQNMTLEFYRTQDPYETDYFYAAYLKDTKEYIGDLVFDGRIPLGVTKDCSILTLIDDNPDDFKLAIENIGY